PPHRRAEGMGYFGLSGNLALAFGPSLGLTLVGVVSFSQLFLISAGLGFVALLLSSVIRYKKVEQSPDKTVTVKLDIDRKSTRLNSSHVSISYAVFCLKKKKINQTN